MIRTVKYLISATLLVLLPGCSDTASAHDAGPTHLVDYYWSLPDDPAHAISLKQAAFKLTNYDVIFFGELHNHPGIHKAQMELFAQLYRLNNNMSLSLEQFERDAQPYLDQYLAGQIGEEYMIDKARAWDHYRSTHRPMVEFARDRGLPVIAANAPRQIVVCVGRHGLEVLERYPGEQREQVAKEIDVEDGAYKDKFLDFRLEDSVHKAPSDGGSQEIMQNMMQRGFEAQAVRDDTMAESIAQHLKKNPERQVLHLNGSFHSSDFLGAVERLQRRLPRLKIAVIHPVTAEEGETIDISRPPGTVLIRVKPLPTRFVNAENRDKWMRKMMKKRMESRKNCPE